MSTGSNPALQKLADLPGTEVVRSLQEGAYPVLITRGAGGSGQIPVSCIVGAYNLRSRTYAPWSGDSLTPAEAYVDGWSYPVAHTSDAPRPPIQLIKGAGYDAAFHHWAANLDSWAHSYDRNSYARKFGGAAAHLSLIHI